VLDRGKVVSWTSDNQPEWMAGTHLEITKDKLAELALEESESRLRILIERFPGGVMVENADRQVVLTNQEFCDIFGIPMSPQALVGIDCRNSAEQVKELFAEPDEFVHRVEEVLAQGRLVLDEVINMADGRVLERHYIPVHIEGEYSGHVWIYRDITERKTEEAHLQHIAYYDTLTDLPNRSLLSDRLNQAIVQAERRKTFVAIAYIDLDGFKEVNDTLGHKAGDDLLISVSNQMREMLREGDTLARLGGDEFVAVMIDLPDMASATPLIDRLLQAASQEIETDEKTLVVSASIGLTFYHTDNALDADHLLRQADHAMYQAKLSGKNRYALFDPQQSQ
jgi:diguanylate cyclase (GGDEF)-like protein/PAS domain S-box-containing protein